MKVTVTQGIRVIHDGELYQDGQSVDVPESVATFWLECGWASEGDGAPAPRDPRGVTNTEPLPQEVMREPTTAPRRSTKAGTRSK
jgi:hypothetical protein